MTANKRNLGPCLSVKSAIVAILLTAARMRLAESGVREYNRDSISLSKLLIQGADKKGIIKIIDMKMIVKLSDILEEK